MPEREGKGEGGRGKGSEGGRGRDCNLCFLAEQLQELVLIMTYNKASSGHSLWLRVV